MTDNWRDIDITTADGLIDLTIVVAEKLGWTDVDFRATWRGVDMWGFPPGEQMRHKIIPEFAGNLNEAILLQHEGAHLDLIIRSGEDGAAIAAYIEDGGYRRISTKSTNPAVAVCLAWLAYFDTQENAR